MLSLSKSSRTLPHGRAARSSRVWSPPNPSGPAQAVAESRERTDEIRDVKIRIHRRLIDEIDFKKADIELAKNPKKKSELRGKTEVKIVSLLDEEAKEMTDRELRKRLVKEILDEALGLGPLEDLLRDSDVSEIMVNGIDHVFVERKGKLTLNRAQVPDRGPAPRGHRAHRESSGAQNRREIADGGRSARGRFPGERHHSSARHRRSFHHHPEIRENAAQSSRPRSFRLLHHTDGAVFRGGGAGAPEHRHLGRHRLREDHALERAFVLRPARTSAS